jgi:thioredoxin-related protein
MKKIAFFFSLIALTGLITAFAPATNAPNPNDSKAVNWVDWDTAVERNKTDKRPFMVDIYTNWCGYCKKMDKEAFTNPEVVKYLNENFHAIKFNAEMKKAIEWNDHTFEWVEGGRNGVHSLAASLLDGKLGYPAFVYLTDDMRRIMISPGYKGADAVMKELTFTTGKHYEKTSWGAYQKTGK